MNLPDGMTAEKLRDIADWLDTYDELAQAHILLVEALKTRGFFKHVTVDDAAGALEEAAGKAVQNDLRRWADDIDWSEL